MNSLLLVIGSTLLWSAILFLLCSHYWNMTHRPRLLRIKGLGLLDNVPIVGTVRTPTITIIACPDDFPWELDCSVATDSNIMRFSLPREEVRRIAFSGVGASWNSEAINLIMVRESKRRFFFRQKFLAIMIDVEDHINLTLMISSYRMRKMLETWDVTNPLKDKNLSDYVDKSLIEEQQKIG